MKNAYANMSEYAISSWTLAKRDLHSALQSIATAGFSTVELWADTIHFDPRTNVSTADVKKWLKTLHLSVHSTHGPFRNFSSNLPVNEFREYRQKLWHKTIEQCAEVNSPIMVVHGLDRKEYNFTNDEIDILGESLADLCEYGRKHGVIIALENIEKGNDPANEIGSNLVDHRKNFSGIGLYYCLDIGHAVLNNVDIIDEIKVAGKELVSLHVHNNNGIDDSHLLPSEEGVIDWNYVYHELRTTHGYEGQFVMEVYGGENPENTLESIQNLFN